MFQCDDGITPTIQHIGNFTYLWQFGEQNSILTMATASENKHAIIEVSSAPLSVDKATVGDSETAKISKPDLPHHLHHCHIVPKVVLFTALIYLGSKYWPGSTHCRKEEAIPVLSILIGCAGFIWLPLSTLRDKFDPQEQEGGQQKDWLRYTILFVEVIGLVMYYACITYMSVIVYRSYKDVDYDILHAGNYCDKTLYRFFFGFVTGFWVVSAIMICVKFWTPFWKLMECVCWVCGCRVRKIQNGDNGTTGGK